MVIRDGILKRCPDEEETQRFQLVLPAASRQQALQGIHNELGHAGRDRTMEIALTRFFWPYMTRDVEHYIASCDRCTNARRLPQLRPQCSPWKQRNLLKCWQLIFYHWKKVKVALVTF